MSRLPKHSEHHLVGRIGWMRAAVLGANDGIISTASLVVGVASAAATQSDVLIAGVAGLVAGAMSMAAGEYVSVSSQSDTEQADLARERKEMSENPEFELDELAEIYVKRGVEQGLARQVAQQLMAKDDLAAHARDELGHVGNYDSASGASSTNIGGHVFDRRGDAISLWPSYRPPPRLFPLFQPRPWASLRFSERSEQEQAVPTSSRHSPGDILGRAGHGYHCGHRKTLRHNRLKDGTARAAIKTAMEVNFLIPILRTPTVCFSTFPSPHRVVIATSAASRPTARLGSGRDAPRQSSHRRCAMPR